MNSDCLLKITKSNLRHNFLPYALLSAALILLAPVIFGLCELDRQLSALPLEMYLSLTGMFVLTPVFMPEQNTEIRDTVRSKRMDCTEVYLIRSSYSLLFMALIIGGFTLYMHHMNCDVDKWHFISGYGAALFLGSVGFFVSGVSGNTVAGFMASSVVYIANFGMGKKFGDLCIFTISYHTNGRIWVLYAVSAVLIITALIADRYKKSI